MNNKLLLDIQEHNSKVRELLESFSGIIFECSFFVCTGIHFIDAYFTQ